MKLSKRQAEVLREVVHYVDEVLAGQRTRGHEPMYGYTGGRVGEKTAASLVVLERHGLVNRCLPLGTGWLPTEQGRRVASGNAPTTAGEAWAEVDRFAKLEARS